MNPVDVSSSTGLPHYLPPVLALVAFVALLFLTALAAIRFFVSQETTRLHKLNRAIVVTTAAFAVLVCAFIFTREAVRPQPAKVLKVDLQPPPAQPERAIALWQRDDFTLLAGGTDGPPLQPVDSTHLALTLSALSQGQRNIKIYIRAGAEVRYKVISDLLNTLRTSGYPHIILVENEPVTPPPNQPPSFDAKAVSKLLAPVNDAKR